MKKIGGLSVMKKALSIVLLLSGLFLYGCGSRGGTTASSGGNDSISIPGGGSQPQLGPAQVFTLNLVDADNVKAARATNFATVDPIPTDVRVVMRLFSMVTITHTECSYTYDEEGDKTVIPGSCHDVGVPKYTEVYKDIQDVQYSGSVAVSMPAADGYTIDVITSQQEGGAGPHNILKYGQGKNVNVGGSNPTSGTITINNVVTQLNMQVADSILSSTPTHTVSFDVTVNNALPFAPAYSVDMTINGGNAVTAISSTNKCTFNAPISTAVATVGVRGTFTLNDVFLKQGDSKAEWIRIFPKFSGESVSSNLSPLIAVTVL